MPARRVAVPSLVAQATVVGMSAAGDSVTVKLRSDVPESPSVTLASPMENDEEPSSSVTVTGTFPVTEP